VRNGIYCSIGTLRRKVNQGMRGAGCVAAAARQVLQVRQRRLSNQRYQKIAPTGAGSAQGTV